MVNYPVKTSLRNSMDKSQQATNMVLEGGTPRLDSIKRAGDEQGTIRSNQTNMYDAKRTNPHGGLIADRVTGGNDRLRCTESFTIGTWNVRGLNIGKLDIVKKEMDRTGVDLMGVSELHWVGSEDFNSGEHVMYYSGNNNERRCGVAFITNKKLAKCVENVRYISDRVMKICIRGKPLNLTIIQVYAPTADVDVVDIEEFYANVQSTLNQTPQNDIIYIIGDFNAKVGNGEVTGVVGSHGLGKRNEAGDHLVLFCQENKFRIANTFFIQPNRRLYTWTSPCGQHRNQIDYILCQQKWRGSVQAAKTLPGEDCGTDHQLLAAKIRVRLSKIKKPIRKKSM
ncbi:craniofacial development protein 2-like [Eublepharis macularius]|uniref:Craniofacial development protein 2-like n=1 Tax=Eublepharis macularius TaxID=481883 RepID=A0AA97LEU1_EUBMA|nr:craniofacial development protein 2-like [Eublepharis macularius]